MGGAVGCDRWLSSHLVILNRWRWQRMGPLHVWVTNLWGQICETVKSPRWNNLVTQREAVSEEDMWVCAGGGPVHSITPWQSRQSWQNLLVAASATSEGCLSSWGRILEGTIKGPTIKGLQMCLKTARLIETCLQQQEPLKLNTTLQNTGTLKWQTSVSISFLMSQEPQVNTIIKENSTDSYCQGPFMWLFRCVYMHFIRKWDNCRERIYHSDWLWLLMFLLQNKDFVCVKEVWINQSYSYFASASVWLNEFFVCLFFSFIITIEQFF